MDIDPAEPAPAARAEPTVHEPVTHEPATHEPAARAEPTADKPAAREPALEPQTPGEPTAPYKSGANGTAADQPAPPAKASRTGRNLPVAIGVGAGLGGLVFLTLLTVKATFLIYVGAAIVIALTELASALAKRASYASDRGAHAARAPALRDAARGAP